MATEDILIRYRADVGSLEADLNKLIKQQEELVDATKANTEEQKKSVSAAEFAAKKRADLLRQEEEKLKKLRDAQKLAFDPNQIEKFNNQIAESQKRIALLSDQTQKSAGAISQAFQGAALAIGAAFSAQQILTFAQQSIGAFVEAEKASQQLRTNIVTLGGEGEEAFKKLNDQADQLAKKTLFDDEDIRAAQSQLSVFGLTADEIEKLLPQVLDFAQATGKDLPSAVQQLGGAVNGIGRGLERYSINVSESATKTENLQAVLAGTARFAGQAEAATTSLAGQLTQKTKQVEELQESIGEKLVPAYIALGKIQLGVVTFFERLATAISENANVFKALIPIVVTYIGYITRAAQISAAKAIATNVEALAAARLAAANKLSAASQRLATAATVQGTVATKAAAVATEVFTVAQKGLNAAIKANPLGLLLGVITTAVVAYQAFADSAEDVSDATKEQSENVKELNEITADYNKKLAVEKAELDRLFNSVKQYNTGSKERQAIINQINEKYGTTLQNLDDEKKFVEQLKTAYELLLPAIEAKFRLEIGEQRFKKAIEQQFDAAEKLRLAEEKRKKELEKIAKSEKEAADAAKKRGQEVLQSSLGATGSITVEAKATADRNKLNEQLNLEQLQADKKAADERLQIERDAIAGLQAANDKAQADQKKGDDQANKERIEAEKKAQAQRNQEAQKAADEAAKIEADRQKRIAEEFAKSVDEFLQLRNEADQILGDLTFDINLNTKGLAPAIDEFQKTAADELQGAIDRLNTQIAANPLAFDALSNDQKLALLTKNFGKFVTDVDNKWKQGGVEIQNTSENITNALGKDFLSLPFDEALKKLPEAAKQYLPLFANLSKDTVDEVKTDADKIAEANKKAAEEYANSWLGRNEQVLESFKDTFNELVNLFGELSSRRLDELQKQTEAELEYLDKSSEINEELLNNQTITEREYLEEKQRLEEEKIRIEEEALAKEKQIKKQQAITEKAAAIFEVALATFKAIGKINADIAAFAALGPIGVPLSANAQLQKTLLLIQAAAQVGAILAQPIPYRKGSKNTGPEGHMARVGEEGEEIVYMPGNSKVLPNRQTRKYGDVLDAMFDNKLDDYILKNYVTPALMEQKKRYDSDKSKGFADNIAKSIVFNGGLTPGEMDRIRRKGQPITNVDELANAIASKLPTRNIYRS